MSSSRNILPLLLLLTFLGACSFDVPEFQGGTSTGEGDAGRDLSQPDLSLKMDQGGPKDFGLLPDRGVVDMPSGADMDQDMAIVRPDMTPPDMNMPRGDLGQACLPNKVCNQGSCIEYEGQEICAESCVNSCQAGFACVDTQCIPETFCSNNKGPGCNTCDKCDTNASCDPVNVGGTVELSCQCKQGWQGDGFTCTDVDECANGSNNCDTNAMCTNVPGRFECKCNAGFLGDGVKCEKAPDECAKCDSNATCEETAQQKTCVCRTGYEGSGEVCSDINECVVGNPCGANTMCDNLPGSVACFCETGYEGDPNQGCTDINECTVTPGICGERQICTNAPGGFNCECPAPFKLVQGACMPYASCAEIKRAFPASATGQYTISTPMGDLQVYCDMTTDNGAGYTLKRFDQGTLADTQKPYKDLCSSWGMEVVTPRTQAHMDAIIAWNSEPPNLVNVSPVVPGASGGLMSWQGQCQGTACSYFVTGRTNATCSSLKPNSTNAKTFWDGSVARDCAQYLADAPTHASLDFYVVDPDGSGPIAPTTAFCVMDPLYDQGGWTLAATVARDGANTWTWNNRRLWTTDKRTFGSIQSIQNDLKAPYIHDMKYRDLYFFHSSGNWASYRNVGDGLGTLDNTIAQTPAPNCEASSGYPMTVGTIAAGAGLCSTDLYFNAGDYDGSRNRCLNYKSPNLINPIDSSTYGPGWSQNRGAGCPFDDPAQSGFGPDYSAQNSENSSLGFGSPLGLNSGMGPKFLQLYLRNEPVLEPNGNNSTGDLLVRDKSPTEAGPQCPYGSWDDKNDQVKTTGWVICAKNDT